MNYSKNSEYTFEKPRLPHWHKNAVIYEVNLRNYTVEGTFKAFQAHLPRLRAMNVDILWFMPVNPVSKKNRKGALGSPYAVADYFSVNPDFGTLEEFKQMVKTIHESGMHVIIDWVPNHTGWDHSWISEHPEWYTKNHAGQITDPINPETGEPWGWTDVADLDYQNRDLRREMIAAMEYWVKEVGIDGFRVDVAHGVPGDFWNECTAALYSLKPLFLLAEAELPALLNEGSFAMDYAWTMHHLFNNIAATRLPHLGAGNKLDKGNLVPQGMETQDTVNALNIDRQLAIQKAAYRKGYKMYFTSNHDENAWAGTEFDRFENGHRAFAVLAATIDGMPLLYSGQESAVDRQYDFFSKDAIPWGTYPYAGFYKTLFELKHRNRALWNGDQGGPLIKIPTGHDEQVYGFMRQREGDRVVVVVNLSDSPQEIALNGTSFAGSYTDVFEQCGVVLTSGYKMNLAAWAYRVLSDTQER